MPSFTVGEAVFLGDERKVGGLLARRRMEREARALLAEQFGVELPKGALIGELTTAQQQLVQIVRALARSPRVLVFDEPTAALVKREVDRLFTNIERLRERGITIVYISHYLQEIERLCDRVTVLRNGRDVGTVLPGTTPAREIARMMVARDIEELFPKRAVPLGAPALAVRDLSTDARCTTSPSHRAQGRDRGRHRPARLRREGTGARPVRPGPAGPRHHPDPGRGRTLPRPRSDAAWRWCLTTGASRASPWTPAWLKTSRSPALAGSCVAAWSAARRRTGRPCG